MTSQAISRDFAKVSSFIELKTRLWLLVVRCEISISIFVMFHLLDQVCG